MSEKSIFDRADFEEIAWWLSYGIEEYHQDYHEEECDSELLKHWNKHVHYKELLGSNSGCSFAGCIYYVLIDDKADQAQLIGVNGDGSFPMGYGIISPASDENIFDELAYALYEEPLMIFNIDHIANKDLVSQSRFKSFISESVASSWPDDMPPFEIWFEKLYEINDFNKFNEWKETFRHKNK